MIPVLFISVTPVKISVYFCRNIKFFSFSFFFLFVAANFNILAMKKD